MSYKLVLCTLAFCIVAGLLWSSCSKQERVYQYHPSPAPEDATGRDTALSVTALRNMDTFKALGRSLKPDSIIKLSFYDFNSSAFLEIVLGSDTPGVYMMGRSISKHTAVYYPDLLSKQSAKGFTSRATDSSGGFVMITEIDTVNFKVKGKFELLLLSRTDPSRYDFKSGSFDITYNFSRMELDGTSYKSLTVSAGGLSGGSAAAPLPYTTIRFPDSLMMQISVRYTGNGTYQLDSNSIVLADTKINKIYRPVSGDMNLLRFNYGEFMQATFNARLSAADGEQRTIRNGVFVLGNIQ